MVERENMITCYVGIDPRSPINGWVCISSIVRRLSQPMKIVPLFGEQTPIKRKGLTSFTFARYAVPWLENYEGLSVFMDSDIIVLDDLWNLFYLQDNTSSVQVVKKEQRFEWPGLMLFHNDRCKKLTPEYINQGNPQSFDWVEKSGVGGLPEEWMFLVDYDSPDHKDPKLIHYTSGTPAFLECRNCDYNDLWYQERDAMLYTCSWIELMGTSVHVPRVTKRLKTIEHTYLDFGRLPESVQRTTQL